MTGSTRTASSRPDDEDRPESSDRKRSRTSAVGDSEEATATSVEGPSTTTRHPRESMHQEDHRVNNSQATPPGPRRVWRGGTRSRAQRANQAHLTITEDVLLAASRSALSSQEGSHLSSSGLDDPFSQPLLAPSPSPLHGAPLPMSTSSLPPHTGAPPLWLSKLPTRLDPLPAPRKPPTPTPVTELTAIQRSILPPMSIQPKPITRGCIPYGALFGRTSLARLSSLPRLTQRRAASSSTHLAPLPRSSRSPATHPPPPQAPQTHPGPPQGSARLVQLSCSLNPGIVRPSPQSSQSRTPRRPPAYLNVTPSPGPPPSQQSQPSPVLPSSSAPRPPSSRPLSSQSHTPRRPPAYLNIATSSRPLSPRQSISQPPPRGDDPLFFGQDHDSDPGDIPDLMSDLSGTAPCQ